MQRFASDHRMQRDGKGHRSMFNCSSGPKAKQREPPRTPPHQQLFAAEPSAPRKRPAPHHEDLSVFEPARKRRAAVVKARQPYLAMDVHVKDSGGLVAISPTGTTCRCHLKPGAICHHEVYEPHVDNFLARAEYEQLSPIKQVLERRRVNQLKEQENQMKELNIDAKVIGKEGPEFVKRETRRERRARKNRSVQNNTAQDKWIHVPREDADLEGFIVFDDDDDGDDSDDDSGDDSGDEGGYVDDSDGDGDEDEDAEHTVDSEGADDLEEDEDQSSEYCEDDDEDGEEGEGGNDCESSLADDEEIPFIPKPEHR